jgi:hypothetical protein
MPARQFYLQLSLLAAGIFVSILILHYFHIFKPYFFYSLSCLGVFIVLSVILFYLAKSAAQSSDKNSFTRLILSGTMIKMFLFIGLIIIFYKGFSLKGNYFLIPFFFIYVCFTAFEVYFLTKIGRAKTPSNPSEN